MKTTRPGFHLLALFLALASVASPARAVLFTSNAVIGPENTFFDGDDLSLSNCTVIVDGSHGFTSLHVLNGGILTHSFSTNGFLPNRHVGSEVQVLNGLSPSPLNQPYVLTNTLVVSDASNVYTQGVDYVSFPASQGFYSLQRLAGSAIPDGGTVFVAYDAQVPAGLYLTVTNNVEVEPGGAIDVTGGGYGPGIGPGAGGSSFTNFPYPFIAGSGAGFGGLGGPSSSLAAGGASYGSVPSPANLGSGGGSGSGPGGAGGGLIQITAGGVLLVNGRISAGGANGLSPHSGGGSGGTIWLSAQVWSGNGTITANGGAGEPFDGGGGAGGRIAVYYASDLFTGVLTALGGAGATYGGAGTIYTQTGSGPGAVVMDNGGPTGASTPYTTVAGADLTIGGGAVGLLLTQTSVGNLLVNSNGWFGLPAGPASMSLLVTNNATIRAGGGIRGDGRGYGAGQGLGAGLSGAGAGHGGYGGASGNSSPGGNAYDEQNGPNQFGSGGGSASGLGGAGGGVVSLSVAGTLSLDGNISVNGNAAPGNGGGGGSGGTVGLAVGRLTGAGSISANGGAGDLPMGGGGAGGCIAIVCTSNAFTGTVSARGAVGANAGAAGTIYNKTNNTIYAQLLVDNGGLRGTNTPITAAVSLDLTARGGAVVLWPARATVRHVFIGSNSLLTAAFRPNSLIANIAGNATVEAGGSILLDGWGAASGSGPGAGMTLFTTGYGNTGGGGGEGGYGGASAFGALGGNVSGSVSAPSGSYGSGGGIGNGTSPNNQGGAGGAAFSLTTLGTLLLDGQISVNGTPGVGQWSGGGSGGSISLNVGNFRGHGRLSANGGAGDGPHGGGGGGGRIAILYKSDNSFNGTISAIGGAGANAGGAGTIYVQFSSSTPTIIVDNGGQRGTNTLLSAPTQCELLVTGGAQLLQGGSNPFVNLFIGSNSVFTWPSPFTARTVTVTSNLVIQAGGKITLDAQGNNQQGTATGGSGAAFGGYGGRANTNITSAGIAYGSVFSDVAAMGSAAGFVVLGGGGLTLNVTRTLLLDGNITANGSNAPLSLITQFSPSAGGGSGGGITINASLLTGSGIISANGGDGTSQGGGGGGGRIAITASNQFTGAISARGGAGFNYGGAGTIYFAFPKIEPKTIEVVLDNGGFRGTNTPVSLSGTYNLTVSGGALGQIQLGTSQPNFRNLLVASNSTLTVGGSFATSQTMIGSNFTIQAGGVLTVDGLGNAGNVGPGAGGTQLNFGGGGGYGGFGGNASNNAAGGNSFGSISAPVDVGCGGGGPANTIRSGAGGGAVTLTANGTVRVDGRLSADGSPALLSGGAGGSGGGGGGGSGGSLRLSARQFLGSGIISASGGAGLSGGGGGGGGRIALTYSNNQFAGSFLARGGIGASAGGAGTIYLKASNSPIAQVIADNGGLLGTNTPISGTSVGGANTYDLVVKSGASVALVPGGNGAFFNNLVIQSNAQLLPSVQGTQIRVNSNAVIEAGGAIAMDGKGAAGGQGLGVGRSSSTSFGVVGGGGGHGGYGGSAPGAAGGDAYGSITSPTTTGSGGGAGTGTSTNSLGGAGGGTINLTVSGTLTLDGRLGVDGLPGVGQWSGGGSGGSVMVAAGKLLGSGTVSANGGAGDPPYGGGGSGGRIVCSFSTNEFQGRFLARGGTGFSAGAAGTVDLRNAFPVQITLPGDPIDQVFVDNGGLLGTNTPIPLLNNFELTVAGGGIANPTNRAVMRNLLVGSNAWLSALPNQTTNLQLVVTSNAVLQAGGGINLDGKGLAGGFGTGVGGFSTGGGGAYGGNGGAAGNSPIGGIAYGSLLQPADVGSGGGGSALIVPPLIGPLGGAGGGALRLTVSNSLVVDGQISANGLTGTLGGGGGSGGALWLSARSLSGSGSISAIGGSGDLPSGGGGGGGRLALYVSSNQFAGAISTRGGSGTNAGGAGTIYLRTNANPAGLVLVDNGGLAGTNTPLSSPEVFSLSLAGRAVASPSTSNLLLSGLVIDSGANLTHLSSQSNLDVIVLGSATIGTNGLISLNARGFSGIVGGPGAGQMPLNNSGSGGGYGGAGGASASGVPGGPTYGSATQPLECGSRGGSLSDYPSFSQGGGAVRLRVSQTLTVNGLLTANGNDALIDRAGGGSGGSIWVTARTLEGRGFITANGGSGEPVEGGGGGGGRIALNTRTNHFTGLAIAAGGYGANWGANGTVVITNIPAPQVIAQNPSDVAFYAVSNVDVSFSSLMNPVTAGPTDFLLNTPDGLVPQAEQSVAALDLSSFRLSFDPLDTIGYYELSTGPNIEDIYGVPMAAASIGSFVIFPPTISGQVTDTNGLPVPFVTMRAGSDFLPVVTDVHGNYSIEVTPGWSGTVTPSKGIAMFVPGSRTYANVGNDLTNQNFVMVSPVSLLLTSQQQGSNLKLGCYGINGVTYQMQYSTNLVDWIPYGSPIVGSNCQMTISAPLGNEPKKFFRFVTSY